MVFFAKPEPSAETPIAASTSAAPASQSPASMPWWRPAMRDVLAVASTGLMGLCLIGPALHVTIDADLKGAVIMQWATVMAYYFGTSKTSVAKDATISQMSKGN